MSSDILVALATYNELDNLPSLVDAIRQQLPAADLLVVDDNSPDGTGRWCEQFAADRAWFDCIHREGKLGLGTATRLAMRTAIDRGYRWLVIMDADWSHSPEYLPAMLAATRQADLVVGSRYCAGGRIEGWPWYRRLISGLLNSMSCRLLRLPVHDASGAFRVYSVEKLSELPLANLRAAGYSFLEEVLWSLHRVGATFAEVPIVFRDRCAGRSKANLRELCGKLLTVARLMFRRRK